MEECRIALAKGRLLKESIPLLERAGLEMVANPNDDRRLILNSKDKNIEFVILRAADVVTYVEYGAADLGIVGKDMLMEEDSRGIYELHDLGIGKCRLSVAGLPSPRKLKYRPRVATKYCLSARRYFAQCNKQVGIIKLYGSMEMAPILGLADLIVDLVDSGKTLAANGLQGFETIKDISARLIANRTAMKIKDRTVKNLVEQITSAC